MKRFLFLALCLFAASQPFVTSLSSKLIDSASGGVKAGGISLWDQATPMLWTSKVVYVFADMLQEAREKKITLKYPEGFPIKLSDYQDKSLDLRYLNNGSGLAFNDLYDFLILNQEAIRTIRERDADYFLDIINKLNARDDQYEGDDYFLTTFRSLRGARQCVYGILKNTKSKRIVIVFRGSVSTGTRDWTSNLNIFQTKMKTPALLKGKLNGRLNERVLVHRGFYDYLFDNDKKKNERERYEMILDDIKPILEENKGYKVFVTGHSLGAGLGSMASFQLAGEDKEWIPKPIMCVTYASPITGTDGYRQAFEQLEKDGLIRYIRFNNNNDFVPAIPPFLLGSIPQTAKHVGMNIRLYDNDYEIRHSSDSSPVKALQNSLFKNPLTAGEQHTLRLHEARMDKHFKEFKDVTVEEIYSDKSIMGKNAVSSSGEL